MKTVIYILFLLFVFNLNAQENKLPTQEINGTLYYQYTVQPGEGLYRISKNFGTSQSEINNVNPQIHDGLHAGMEILIPVIKDFTPILTSVKTEATIRKTEKLIDHLVERKQTVFAICKQHHISQDDFRRANPEITKTRLKAGQIVKIPVFVLDTIAPERNNDPSEQIITNDQSKTFKIAFMLPFMLNQNKTDLAVKRFVEFYSGAVVALQQFKESGYTFEVYTYDTEKSENKLAEILDDSLVTTMDLIIGPAYSSQVSMIGDYARMHKVKTIIPFTSKIIDLTSNPWLYQFNPGQDLEIKYILDFLSESFSDAHITLLQADQTYVADENFSLIPQLQNALSDKNIEFQTQVLSDSIAISTFLSKNKPNILFFNTGKINQVANELKELKRIGKDSLDILVYEPLSWKNSKVEKPETFSFTPFKKDFDSENYAEYQIQYMKLFGAMPDETLPRYDLIGFDLVKYSVPNILWKEPTKETKLNSSEGLQSDIQFVRPHRYSGFINNKMIFIKSSEKE